MKIEGNKKTKSKNNRMWEQVPRIEWEIFEGRILYLTNREDAS